MNKQKNKKVLLSLLLSFLPSSCGHSAEVYPGFMYSLSGRVTRNTLRKRDMTYRRCFNGAKELAAGVARYCGITVVRCGREGQRDV